MTIYNILINKYQRQLTNDYQSSTPVENPLQISLFMQNKPNFRNDKMNISLDVTVDYKILSRWRGEKTNPIQTQYKPNQSQFWANIKGGKSKQTQYKPISKAKYDCFCVDKDPNHDKF